MANALKRHILQQVSRTLEGSALRIAEALVDQVNDSGYLDRPLPEVRAAVDALVPSTSNQLLAVLHHVQRLDPPGFGAADAFERMTIQYSQRELP